MHRLVGLPKARTYSPAFVVTKRDLGCAEGFFLKLLELLDSLCLIGFYYTFTTLYLSVYAKYALPLRVRAAGCGNNFFLGAVVVL